jgi:PAS domain S-box-containing protein
LSSAARLSSILPEMLDSLPDGIVLADVDGKILFANRAARRLSGGGRANLPPSDWSTTYGLTVPGSNEPFPSDQLPLARAIHGETIREDEVFVRNPSTPDGAWVSVSGGPILDEHGAIQGGVVVFRDITRRKTAEALTSRLASAVAQTADAVMITDRAGTILYVNPAFESTTGYTSGDVVGRTPRILKSGVQSSEYYQELWRTILAGSAFRGTTINRKKNGDLYYAEQSITPMTDSEGRITHFVSVLKDMTERRTIQEQDIEMRVASRVQRFLFPTVPPMLEGYDIAGAAFPAQATCGDYFDFVTAGDGSLLIAIADARGHGIGPALVMVETRTWVHSLAQRSADPAAVLDELNRALLADLEEGNFVTMLLVRLDHRSGRLTYCNAGHPDGLIVDVSGNVRCTLHSTGVPLAMFADREFSCGEDFVLAPGEVLVLLTDGVLESQAPDGTDFESARLLEVVRQSRHLPAQEIVDRIRSAVDEFVEGAPQGDDISIVICKRDPNAG